MKTKSTETNEKSLGHVHAAAHFRELEKSYARLPPVSQKTDPAVDAAGLFENQIRRLKMLNIAFKKSRSQWTATVETKHDTYACTICKPRSYDPLQMYWWEVNGVARRRAGAGSTLDRAISMVHEAVQECETKAVA